MNYITVSIKEARNNLSELIERAALAKDSFLVTKFGKPKALIISTDIIKKKKIDKRAILKKTAGLWADRKDIKDSDLWVRNMRKKESTRYEKVFS